MKRKFVSVPTLVLLALTVIVYLSFLFVVRKALETKFTQSLGLKVKIAGLQLSPFSGKIRMEKCTIANPPGFTSATLFSLKSGTIYLGLSSLLQDTVVIDAINLRGVSINAEHSKHGFNLDYLKKTGIVGEDRGTNKNKSAPGKQQHGKGREFRIKLLSVKNIEVQFSSFSMGVKSIHFKLPGVTLRNLSGEEEKALSLDEILYKTLCVLIEKVSLQTPEIYQDTIKKFLTDNMENYYKK